MTGWLGHWANLLLRWTHFIAGIAWIGSSFYFIWLDRALTQPAQSRAGVEGDLWMVHSGGFYQVEQRRPAPGEIPPVLHWFKYEALLTWITGISLLVLLYYLSDAYLLDPGVSRIGRAAAIGLGAGLLVVGWLCYDLLWRSPLATTRGVAGAISLAGLFAITLGLSRLLSGRAAFMHVGALIGTIMVANVWRRILPAQQQMVDATRAGRGADFTVGEQAKQRSVHNSYMTFPLLFIMISNHFPATYSGPRPRGSPPLWALGPAAVALAAAIIVSTPHAAPRRAETAADSVPSFATVRAGVAARCQPCHSRFQLDRSVGPAPGGVTFDTPESIERLAERIRVRRSEERRVGKECR